MAKKRVDECPLPILAASRDVSQPPALYPSNTRLILEPERFPYNNNREKSGKQVSLGSSPSHCSLAINSVNFLAISPAEKQRNTSETQHWTYLFGHTKDSGPIVKGINGSLWAKPFYVRPVYHHPMKKQLDRARKGQKI